MYFFLSKSRVLCGWKGYSSSVSHMKGGAQVYPPNHACPPPPFLMPPHHPCVQLFVGKQLHSGGGAPSSSTPPPLVCTPPDPSFHTKGDRQKLGEGVHAGRGEWCMWTPFLDPSSHHWTPI